MTPPHRLFDTLQEFDLGEGQTGRFYSLPALEKAGLGPISRLPVSLRLVLEAVLRNCDGRRVQEENVRTLAAWRPTAPRTAEIPFSRTMPPLNVITSAAYPNGDYNADGTNADRPNAPSDSIARSGFGDASTA